MKVKTKYFLILLLVFVGCTKTGNLHLPSYSIEQFPEPVELKLTELGVYDIQYIPLETNTNSLFSYIINIKSAGNFFYLNISNTILKFDSNGRFVCRVGARGKRTGEYQTCNGYSIHPQTEQIYVLSAWQDKIYIYSSDGKFLKEIPCPQNATDLFCMEDQILCYCNNVSEMVENSFEVIDYEGNTIKEFRNKYKYEAGNIASGFITECFLYMQNGELCSKEVLSDTIFIFRNRQFVPKLVLDRGKKRLAPDARNSGIEEDARNKYPYITDFDLIEFDDFIYFRCAYKKWLNKLIIQKRPGSQYPVKLVSCFINDIDGGPDVSFTAKKDDQTIISMINAFELKDYILTDKFKSATAQYPERKKELEKLANSLKENDNPVLMLVRLKE